jgi:elongator complex protein 1
LVLILANGEIVLYPVDENNPRWDIVGAFEGGLETAVWSPDETLLMLATSKYSLFGSRFDSNSLQPMESSYR